MEIESIDVEALSLSGG